MARGVLARYSGGYRSALLVSENNDQFRAQVLGCILDAAENGVVDYIPRNSYYEQIAQSFVEEQLGRNSRVGAAENHREWVLIGNQFAPPPHGFVGMPLFVSRQNARSQPEVSRAPGPRRGTGLLPAPGAGSETRNSGASAQRRSEKESNCMVFGTDERARIHAAPA